MGYFKARRAHPGQNLFDGKDRRRASQEIGVDANAALREEGFAGFREGLIAADMIRVGAGVDHVTDRLRGNLLDGFDYGIRARSGARVDNHHAIGSHLKADVAAGAGDHIEIRPHLQDFKMRGGRLLRYQTTDSGQGCGHRDCGRDLVPYLLVH